MTSPLQRIQAQLAALNAATNPYALPDRYSFGRGAPTDAQLQSQPPLMGLTQLPMYWQPPPQVPMIDQAATLGPGAGPGGMGGMPGGHAGESMGGGPGDAGGPGGGGGGIGIGGLGAPNDASDQGNAVGSIGSPVSNQAAGMIGSIASAITGIPALGFAAQGINSAIGSIPAAAPVNDTIANAQAQMDAQAVENAANSAIGAGGANVGAAAAADAADGTAGVGVGEGGIGSSGAGTAAGDAAGNSEGSGGPANGGGIGADGGGGGGGGGGGCYLTEAITRGTGKGDDALELEVMRAFRDHYMMQDPRLTELVHQYYGLAPKVVAALNRRPDADELYSSLRERYLLPGVKQVLAGDPEAALKTYTDMLAFASPFAESTAGDALGEGAEATSDALRGYEDIDEMNTPWWDSYQE